MTALYSPNQERIDHALRVAQSQKLVVTQNAILIQNAMLFGGNRTELQWKRIRYSPLR